MAGLTLPTWEDERIKKSRGRMGVILLRKELQSRGLSSGSIVKLKGSKLIPKWEEIEYGLITSDKYLPLRGIAEGYFIQYWTSDLKTVKKHSLREVAQSDDFYRPTPGLALIPVRLTTSVLSGLRAFAGLNSSVIDERRAFRVSYHSGGEESENKNKRLCIGRSGIEHTIEEFSLITKINEQGRLQYELADSKYIYRNYDDIIAKCGDLCPHGAAIFENDDEPQPTSEPSCQIGILNFTEEGVISPIFFTPETLTGEVQLYYPSDVQEEASPAAMEHAIPVNSSAGGTENPDGAANDLTVRPDDYTLKDWQKLYENVKDENTKLKQQCERNEDLLKENENMRSKTEELRKRCKQLQEDRAVDRKDYRVLLTENEQLKTHDKGLREDNRKLRAENIELRRKGDAESEDLREDNRKLRAENIELRRKGDAESKELREDNRKLRTEKSDLRENWDAESKELHLVIEELHAQKIELTTENQELRREKEELSARHKDQLKELLKQPDSAVRGDDTSRIKDSNEAKAGEPSGSPANSLQGDSEEKPFLNRLSQGVSPDCIQ